MTVRNRICLKIDSVNPLYLITDKINGYIKKSNGKKYLLVPTDGSKDPKKHEELRSKIRDLIRSIANK